MSHVQRRPRSSAPRRARVLLASVLVSILAAACSESPDDPPLTLDAGCQPLLGGDDCFLPYPSDFFRVADPSTVGGHRIVTGGPAKLVTGGSASADVGDWRAIPGYSRIPTIVALLSDDVSTTGLVGVLDPYERSLSLDSPTLILDADTLERVPHYADVDPRADDPHRQAIVLHPVVALRPDARYLVAIHGVRRPNGSVADPASGFRRMRDRAARSEDTALTPLGDRFEAEVFAPLSRAGVARESLQLAWDFTTGPGEWAAADLLAVREQTVAWLAANTPAITIDAIEDAPAPNVWRLVRGTVTGPSFMTTNAPGGELARGPDGRVIANGLATFPFTAQIPTSVRDQLGPGRALGYGHGFFGSRAEVEADNTRLIADRVHAVTFAIDWWGMTRDDLGTVVGDTSGQPWRMPAFTDRVHQAMANWMTMTQAISSSLAPEAAFHRPSGDLVYDPASVGFLGISQGGILGGTLAALDPKLSRVCLEVGGAGLTHAMFRSNAFTGFLGLVSLALRDPLDQQKFVATLQAQLDRIDPATYAPHVLSDKLPGSPAGRHVLLQAGLGDVAVPNVASWLETRLLGMGELAPSAYPVFGVPQVAAPAPSALTVFDFGIDLKSVYDKPVPHVGDNPVHMGLRVSDPALVQMDRFFADGTVIDPCGGPCRIAP